MSIGILPGDRVQVSNPKSTLRGELGTVAATYGRLAWVVMDCDFTGPVAEFGFHELEPFEPVNEGRSSFSLENSLTECKS